MTWMGEKGVNNYNHLAKRTWLLKPIHFCHLLIVMPCNNNCHHQHHHVHRHCHWLNISSLRPDCCSEASATFVTGHWEWRKRSWTIQVNHCVLPDVDRDDECAKKRIMMVILMSRGRFWETTGSSHLSTLCFSKGKSAKTWGRNHYIITPGIMIFSDPDQSHHVHVSIASIHSKFFWKKIMMIVSTLLMVIVMMIFLMMTSL